MEDFKPSTSMANCAATPSIQVLQDWDFCMRLESYSTMFRSILEKFNRDIKASLTHILIIHNETCACQIECASEVNKVWNQKKLAFLELQKLSGLTFDDYLGRVLRLLLNNNLQNVEPLSESDFWQHLRHPFPSPSQTNKGGTIDDEELADIQSFIMKDIEMGPTSSNHNRQRFQQTQTIGPSEMSPSPLNRAASFEQESSPYDCSNDELVRMKRKEKHMAPIDCTGVSASFGHTWFCKPCGKVHKCKEECVAYKHIHNPRKVISNLPNNPGGLPNELTVYDGRVYTKQGVFLSAFTRLGPLKGVICDESKVDFDDDRSHVWLLHKENGTRRCVLTSSESDSNWVRDVEPAESPSQANCCAVSIKNQIYLVTCADIGGDNPLAYFAKEDPTTEFWTSWTQAWANQKNCSRCSVHGQFDTVADYRVHISLWHDMSFQGNPQNRIYYCPDCNSKRIGAKEIVHHCKESHGTLPFQCRGCTKRFETYNSLIKHKKRLHSEEKPLKKSCDKCDKVYLDPKALKQHVKQVHERSDQLHCSQCEMILSSKYALNRHIKEVHHRQQTHVCTHCLKQFTQQSNLKQHLLIHYGVKPFLCQHLACKSAFTTKQCLQVHYRKVHRYSDEEMPDIKREKTRLDELLLSQSARRQAAAARGGGCSTVTPSSATSAPATAIEDDDEDSSAQSSCCGGIDSTANSSSDIDFDKPSTSATAPNVTQQEQSSMTQSSIALERQHMAADATCNNITSANEQMSGTSSGARTVQTSYEQQMIVKREVDM